LFWASFGDNLAIENQFFEIETLTFYEFLKMLFLTSKSIFK